MIVTNYNGHELAHFHPYFVQKMEGMTLNDFDLPGVSRRLWRHNDAITPKNILENSK